MLDECEKKISITNLSNNQTFGFRFTIKLKVVILFSHLTNPSASRKTKRITLPQKSPQICEGKEGLQR